VFKQPKYENLTVEGYKQSLKVSLDCSLSLEVHGSHVASDASSFAYREPGLLKLAAVTNYPVMDKRTGKNTQHPTLYAGKQFMVTVNDNHNGKCRLASKASPLIPWQVIYLLQFLVLATSSLLANNPGGNLSTVTTAVTTGTEAFSTRTDHYLDNGILHVLITDNGNVDSIKYLKPGSSGTPKANGTELVSQSGINFGNHTAIYYYWYPDGNGSGSYVGVTTVGTYIDLATKHTYNSATDLVPIDMEIHYVLGKGNTALYVYMVAHHPTSYSVYGDANIDFIQCIWPTAHDTTNFLCEKQYLDNAVKYSLYLNGTQQTRNGLQPSFYDNEHTIPVAGFPKEIAEFTTGTFANQINGKYSFTFDYPTLDTWGMASDTNHIGLWVVMGSHEYQNNGPTACEYAGGIGGITGFEPLIAHYSNTGLTVPAATEWTKIYGPWAFYFNSMTTGTAAWADAQNQGVAEKTALPYSWLVNSAYQPKAPRATVTGKLVITDALRPGSNAAGAWVGLAKPDNGAENAPDNWQFQSDGYQYWVQADASGNFAIPNVQTFGPDGTTTSYELYAYSSGPARLPSGGGNTQGSVGEYSTGPFTLTSGTIKNLGTLTWNVPHLGAQLVWEIGIPNRSATEFKHGDEYGVPGLWTNFINEFTNPLEYNIGTDWTTGINYAHTVDNMATSPWRWHLNFNLTSINKGTYWLNIAYASPDSRQIIRINDDSTIFADFTPDNSDPSQTTVIRQGIHTKYGVAHVAIPWSKLQLGANTITLDHEYHSDHGTAHFMYDYINLEGPAPVVLPPGRDLMWKGGVSSNAWDDTAANWIVSGSSSPTVAYVDGDRPTFDDTGSTSPSISLSGTLTPGQVTFSNTTKNYTVTGPGVLMGPMELLKSGSGVLTISPTQVIVTGTITSGSPTINIPTGSLGVGMSVAGTGIASSTTVTSISANSLTLSQNATVTGTNPLTFSAAYSFNGGSTISAGTVVFGNDTANSNGLGTGPMTLDGATLQMYSSVGNYDSEYWDINVDSGSTSTIDADARIDIHGNLSGGGTLNLYVPWVRTTIYGNWGNFLGHINVTTNTSTGGDFRVANGNAFPNASVYLGPKVNAYYNVNGGGTFLIGELTGDATSQLQGINYNNVTPGAYTATWAVGGLNTNATYAGWIKDGTSPSNTAVSKIGDGIWTLSGSCSYTGPTNVLGGTLRITGSGANSTSLNVASGATLEVDGSLTVNGPIVNNGTVRLIGSAVLLSTGTFTNYGALDVITSTRGLPGNLVNLGTIIDVTAVQSQESLTLGTTPQLSILSYAGHNYQLQRTATLVSPAWVNVGAAQVGTGAILTLADTAAPAAQGFYRMLISP
jgi:autotransporter-associated beta strand protein